MSDKRILEMPATRFWLLHKCIDRVAAEESIRTAMIGASVQSADGMAELMKNLQTQMGDVVLMDKSVAPTAHEKLDRTGLHALKAVSGTRKL